MARNKRFIVLIRRDEDGRILLAAAVSAKSEKNAERRVRASALRANTVIGDAENKVSKALIDNAAIRTELVYFETHPHIVIN